jgi:hypothetical protein
MHAARPRPQTRRLAFCLAAVLAWAAPTARAQCGTGSTRNFDALTVSPTALTIPDVGVTEFDRGYSATAQYTITVDPRSNNNTRTWYLCVQADSPTFPAVSGYAKPIGDLQWSLNGTTWTSASAGTQQVVSDKGIRTLPLYVRLLVNYAADAPGTYGPAPLTFTASH